MQQDNFLRKYISFTNTQYKDNFRSDFENFSLMFGSVTQQKTSINTVRSVWQEEYQVMEAVQLQYSATVL